MTDESGSPRRPAWRSPSRSSPAASSPRSRRRSADSCARRRSPEHDGRTRRDRPSARRRMPRPSPTPRRPPREIEARPSPPPTPPRRQAGRAEGRPHRGTCARRFAGACLSGRPQPSPRTTPSPRPDAAASGRHRHRRRPADHRAQAASAPRQRRGTGPGRRAGPTRVPRRREAAADRAFAHSRRTQVLRTSSFCANVQPDGCRSGVRRHSTASSTPLPTALGVTSWPSPSGAGTACRRWRSTTR